MKKDKRNKREGKRIPRRISDYRWADFLSSYNEYEKSDGGWGIIVEYDSGIEDLRVEDGCCVSKGKIYPMANMRGRLPEGYFLILRNLDGDVFELYWNKGWKIRLTKRS